MEARIILILILHFGVSHGIPSKLLHPIPRWRSTFLKTPIGNFWLAIHMKHRPISYITLPKELLAFFLQLILIWCELIEHP